MKERGGDLEIFVEEAGSQRDELLEVFRGCQEGACPCPLDAAGALGAMEVECDDDWIEVRIRRKQESRLDVSLAQRCFARLLEKMRKS